MLVYLKTALPSSHHRAPNVIMLVGKTSGVTWCQRLGRWASLSLSLCVTCSPCPSTLSHCEDPPLSHSHTLRLSFSPSFVPSLNFHPPSTQLTSHATVKLLISRRAYFPSFAELTVLPGKPILTNEARRQYLMHFWNYFELPSSPDFFLLNTLS